MEFMAFAAEAAAPPTGIDITQFLQFGLLGLIFACLVAKKFIVPEWTLKAQEEGHNRELKVKDAQIVALEADKAELKESLTALQGLTRDQIIPALVRSNQLSADYVSELSDNRRDHRGDDAKG